MLAPPSLGSSNTTGSAPWRPGRAGTPSGSDTRPTELPVPPSKQSPDSAAQAAETRARAEALYKKGYQDSEAAKKDLAAKKPKDAEKKFAKALKRFDEALKFMEWVSDGHRHKFSVTGDEVVVS